MRVSNSKIVLQRLQIVLRHLTRGSRSSRNLMHCSMRAETSGSRRWTATISVNPRNAPKRSSQRSDCERRTAVLMNRPTEVHRWLCASQGQTDAPTTWKPDLSA